jgi:hypothetical protein
VKVPGGYDFAGDAYDANSDDPAHGPVPDANPMDSSNGHGTACASLIGGYGVNGDGSTYGVDGLGAIIPGSYTSTASIAPLRISPGFAPGAQLYPLRVFGVEGSTNLVVEAIEWAIDNNVDVISMSLGANSGSYTDPDAVAASLAADAGIMVVSAAGNAGDSYFIVSAPSVANNTMSVAASFNNTGGYVYDSSVTVTAGANVGAVYTTLYGDPAVPAGDGLSGKIVYAVPATGQLAGSNPAVPVAALTNAADIAGNICMIDRGGISFYQKVILCEAAGATATIVAQSASGSNTPYPIPMALTPPDTEPPSPPTTKTAVMIGYNDANAIKAALVSGEVDVTIADANGFANFPASATPDTMASYSARGPRMGDAALKPDITAPAEVVAVATSLSGDKLSGFNGTSSATPHVSGIMALLKQLHPTWTPLELMALAMGTANHDITTVTGGSTKYGTGRAGAGRIDVGKAASGSVIAYNSTDEGVVGVSFGIVEVPANATAMSLSKDVTIANKGGASVTYNVTYQDMTPLSGATFLPSVSSVTVGSGSSDTVSVALNLNGTLLLHTKDPTVGLQLPAGLPRQYLTEKTGYLVFTPTAGSEPVLRVALYASVKPVSDMHSDAPEFVADAVTGSFDVTLAGLGFTHGSTFPTEIDSIVKPFELQYASSEIGASEGEPTSADVIKYVAVTSDYLDVGQSVADTLISFAVEGFGNAMTPDYLSSDKEIYFDTDMDGVDDYAMYLTSVPNGTASSNVYVTSLVNLNTGSNVTQTFTNLYPGTYDSNIFANSTVVMGVFASDLGLETGASKFSYQVVTWGPEGIVDLTPPLVYSVEEPGLVVTSDSQFGPGDPYFFDYPSFGFTIGYNGVNYQVNDSLGLYLAHMHNATGNHGEVVDFTSSVANLFWRHHDDFNYRWVMNVDEATNIGLPTVVGAGWVIAGLGDVDGDGKQDMIWYYEPYGVVYAWLMSGTGIKQGGVVGLGGVGPDWKIVTVTDLNGDGTADILWRHSTGVVYAWYMSPDATVASVQALGSVDPTTWKFAGAGHFDGNATSDVVWTYEVPGPLFGVSYVWQMGATSVTAVTALGSDGGKSLVKVGDFDGDGASDLLWRDVATGANDIWYMNGTAVSATQVMPSVAAGYEAAAAVDFDADGKTDLLWHLPSTGALTQWLMQGRGVAPVVNDLGAIGSGWFLPGQ